MGIEHWGVRGSAVIDLLGTKYSLDVTIVVLLFRFASHYHILDTDRDLALLLVFLFYEKRGVPGIVDEILIIRPL